MREFTNTYQKSIRTPQCGRAVWGLMVKYAEKILDHIAHIAHIALAVDIL